MVKSVLTSVLRMLLIATAKGRKGARQLFWHAYLSSQLKAGLPVSVVVLGRVQVFGTREIEIGDGCFFYPDLHLETQEDAKLVLGERVVLSRGVHLVAMSGVTIGDGSMIGEYTSIRDANHNRVEGKPLRDAGHSGHAITIGKEVWVGRGVTILSGVAIGDGATIGANAVVTSDVPAGVTVVGVPAKPIVRR